MSEPRPVVGVTSSRRGGRIMWTLNALSLIAAGARPRRIVAGGPGADIAALDGLVIGGGDDLGAELYRGDLNPAVKVDPERDALEMSALEAAADRGLPVLGICRGAQLLNVFAGGSLHQEVGDAFPHARLRRTVLPRKTVRIDPPSRLARLLNCEEAVVNSLHHQAVDRLADGFRAAAWDGDGIVQAIECADYPYMIGVQWHPEFLIYHGAQRRLFRGVVQAVRRRRA